MALDVVENVEECSTDLVEVPAMAHIGAPADNVYFKSFDEAEQADHDDASEKLPFSSMQEVDEELSRIFGPGRKRYANDVFSRVTDEQMSVIFTRAFNATPWISFTTNKLTYCTPSGVSIILSYNYFLKCGRAVGLNAMFQKVVDAYLDDYEHACEFLALPDRFFSAFGGWKRVRKWWFRMIKASFMREFEACGNLHVWHQGKKIRSMSDLFHNCDIGKKEKDSLAEFYNRCLDEYLATDFGHVKRYLATVKKLDWIKVPASYHEDLVRGALIRTPYQALERLTVSSSSEGRERSSMYFHYHQVLGLGEVLRAVYDKVFEELFLSDLGNVLKYIKSKEFNNDNGGWRRLGDRWRSFFIINAVLQSPDEKPARTNLVYQSKGGESVSLATMYHFYRDNGRLDEFTRIYNDALRFKAENKARVAEKTSEVKPKNLKKDRSPDWVDSGELRQILEKFDGASSDQKSELKWAVVRIFDGRIRRLAGRYDDICDSTQNDLVQDARVYLYDSYLRWFDLKKCNGSPFAAIYRALKIFINTRIYFYRSNSGATRVRAALNYSSRYKVLCERRGVTGDFMKDDPLEISRITGRGVDAILGARGVLEINYSLFEPVGNDSDDGDERKDFIPDVAVKSAEAVSITQESTDLVVGSLDGMAPKTRFLVANAKGIRDKVLSVFELMKILDISDDIDVVAVVGKLLKKLKITEECAWQVLYDPKSVVRARLFAQAANGQGDKYSAILNDFDDREQLIIRSLFPVPAVEINISRLAGVYGVSPQAISLKISREVKRMKEVYSEVLEN